MGFRDKIPSERSPVHSMRIVPSLVVVVCLWSFICVPLNLVMYLGLHSIVLFSFPAFLDPIVLQVFVFIVVYQFLWLHTT